MVFSWKYIGIVAVALATGVGFFSIAAQDAASFEWQELGEKTYSSSCASCHQANGQGVPAAFPPLAGHLPEVYSVEGGRDYLIRVVLFGLQGQIQVNEESYNGSMPAFGQFSDEQIAAVLNHELSSWENSSQLEDFRPIQPTEVADARGEQLTPQQVYERRQSLELAQEGAATDGASTDQNTQISVLDGVYTTAQASRGGELFPQHCAECHGNNLSGSEAGPGLAGSYFHYKWDGRTVGELFAYTSTNMPLDHPGALRDDQYADLIAYILSANDYPAGDTELIPDTTELQNINIESAP